MPELRFITFRVGAETFVLDIMAVRQIIPYTGTTAVPTAPAFVEGIIVLRSEVLPIIDLRDRFEIEQSQRAQRPLIIITHTASGPIGLKVDEVKRIVTASTDALLPPPPLIRGIRGDLLIAILNIDQDVYLLIDVESILSTEEKGALAAADLRETTPAE
ncbi:MAG TPA: chemotaxis protein CheW [Thermoanaerobaculia bacterium]|jgi:purine-binding chemotaxis protein CheW|nr:chemotaxis protein CheW [Thermoanaerobaculia bacterium]